MSSIYIVLMDNVFLRLFRYISSISEFSLKSAFFLVSLRSVTCFFAEISHLQKRGDVSRGAARSTSSTGTRRLDESDCTTLLHLASDLSQTSMAQDIVDG